jgi:pSer/pThr/pTyr-binding forkhead associated (FHA) protein
MSRWVPHTAPAPSGARCDLVLPDRTRAPVPDAMTIGRAPGSALRLADPTVSRRHARITTDGGTPVLWDAAP